MKLLRWVLSILFVLLILSGGVAVALAEPLTPQTPPVPPAPPMRPHMQAPGYAEGISSASTSADLFPLKAVLLVGPIDGDNGSWTIQEKQNMDLAAAELEAHGVEVFKFYTPQNDWAQIKAAAEGAHFLFYRGHGVYWTGLPHPTVGGFSLKDKFVSSDDIRDDLHLSPNAIVMLYGCFAAGSSGITGDDIDSVEAQRRVVQYSAPFFDVGAAGYYADWFGDAFQMFVRYLFQGMTLGEAYESYFDFNSQTVERYVYPNNPQMALWLDKDDWDGIKYNNAFVGLADHTLSDLFQSTQMTVTMPSLTHVTEPCSETQHFTLGVNSTSVQTFTWSIDVAPRSAAWLDVTPTRGESGQALQVSLDPTGYEPGVYQASIHIVAGTPDVQNRELDIPVTLRVLQQVHRVHLPMVLRGSTP